MNISAETLQIVHIIDSRDKKVGQQVHRGLEFEIRMEDKI